MAALAVLAHVNPVSDFLYTVGNHIDYLAGSPNGWQSQLLGGRPIPFLVWIFACLSGVAGVSLLLLRSRWAALAFGMSFVAWMSELATYWIPPQILALSQPNLYAGNMVFPAVIAGLTLYALWMAKRGVLR